jgi:hypothetical protein
MSSTKKALLIGCTYPNDPNNQLYGCINDVTNISNTLVDAFDYDLNNITLLRDDFPNHLPTKSNILYHLNKLAQESAKLTEIWFSYSGHGTQIGDANNDETDRADEVIVPTDFLSAGFITDDEIFDVLKKVSSKCRVILLFDSCHSGSICDLQYLYLPNNSKSSVLTNKVLPNKNVVCFSGCRDPETSAETYNDTEQRAGGVFTTFFLYCLRLNHFNVDVFKLHKDICNLISSYGYSQNPLLTSSSSKLNMIFSRCTYVDVATLKTPNPKLLTSPITSAKSRPLMKMMFSSR